MENLQVRYAKAILAFLKDLHKDNRSVAEQQVKEMLVKVQGNFLHLCVVLVHQGLISLASQDQVVGLGKAIDSVRPKTPDSSSSSSGPAITSKDPLDGVESWPAREKRENGE